MCFVFSSAYLVLLLEFLLIYLGNEWKFILWSILDCSLIISFWGINPPISCIFWCSFMVFWVVSFSLLCVVIDIYFFIVDSFLFERVCGVWCVCVCVNERERGGILPSGLWMCVVVCVCVCVRMKEREEESCLLGCECVCEWKRERRNLAFWVVNVALQIFLHVICQYPKGSWTNTGPW